MAITTVSSHVVSVNAIQGTLIADNAITAVHIATNAVSGTLIADNAVTATHIAQNTITVTQLADDAVEADKIADGVITTNHLNKAMISSQTEVTPVAGDFVLLGDTSDSNNLKKAPLTLLLNSNVDITSKANIASPSFTGTVTITGASSAYNTLQLTSNSTGHGTIINLGDTSDADYGSITQFASSAGEGGRMRFIAGTTETMNLRGGKVGIGVSNPDAPLHINGSANSEQVIITGNTNANRGLSIQTAASGGQQDAGVIFDAQDTENGANPYHAFKTAGTERMRIDSSGNVLVGTSTFNNLSTESGVLASNNVVMARGGLADHQDACAVLQYTSDAAWLRAYGDTSGSGYMVFRTGGGAGSGDTERMRITNAGHLLIGATSTNFGAFSNSTSPQLLVAGTMPQVALHETDTDIDGYIGISGSTMFIQTADAIPIRFGTSDVERMRIASNGRVGIGTTGGNAGLHVANGDIRATGAAFANDANSISMSQESSGGFITARGPSTSERGVLGLSVNRSNGGGGIVALKINNGGSINYGGHTGEATGSTGGITMSVDNNDRMNLICATTGTGNLELIEFRNPNGTVGDIKSNGSSTSYNTSSDYRLKENINYTWDATTRLKQLKPARFNFKTDTDKTLDGFLAHEVSSIVPEAISGEKDGEKMQSIDQSKLVPLLVKTIQELEARITTLEG